MFFNYFSAQAIKKFWNRETAAIWKEKGQLHICEINLLQIMCVFEIIDLSRVPRSVFPKNKLENKI